MSITSLKFFLLVAVVFILYWNMPKKYRNYLLLFSNYVFYVIWSKQYFLILLITTLITYFTGICLDKYSKKKKKILILSIVTTLSFLVYFKYLLFFVNSFIDLLNVFDLGIKSLALNIIMPIGISFYTFTSISYIVDVYKNKAKAEHNFVLYALYISFFPTLLSGPIERVNNLLPQLKKHQKFDYDKAMYGFKLIIWGLLKKVVVANTLGLYVDRAFGNIYSYTGFSLVIISLFYTFQIYFDFAGYSDIVIGISKLFGIDLQKNFNLPYFSKSIKEFWGRWHISLSSWLKDYVYIPLGGNRVGKIRHKLNLLITFLVSGLWHGAAWNFIFWGGLHGVAQIVEGFFHKKDKPRKNSILKNIVSIILVFIFVNICWIFFRANNLNEAFYVLNHMFDNILNPLNYIKNGILFVGIDKKIILSIGVVFIYDFCSLKFDVIEELNKKSKILDFLTYLILVLMIIFLAPIIKNTNFIYFQF